MKSLLISLSAVVLFACGDPLVAAGQHRSALEDDALLARLRALPGVTVEERPAPAGTRGFSLTFQQPVDHTRPERGTFTQRALLLHRDVSRPMVLASTGYGLFASRPTDTEPSALLHANSLYLEHRFFEGSTPDPLAWDSLSIRQAAADHHHVVELLKTVYPAHWLATGGSKGGMTSLYHQRFYPRDLDGTVAYVAPNSYGTDDPRYPAFLERVGSAECRARIIDFQRALLSRADELLPLVQAEADAYGLTYQQVGGLDVALEHAAQEFRFALWQYADEDFCATLPPAGAPATALMATLNALSGPATLASDQMLAFFGPYYYQAATQLGSYGPLERHLRGLLRYPGTYRVERYSPVPVTHFDPLAMPEMQAWLALQGERVMLIYGQNDPWSAGAFQLGLARDSYRYVLPGGNHITAYISVLPEPQRSEALATLARWAGLEEMTGSAMLVGPPEVSSLPPEWSLDRLPPKWSEIVAPR